MIKAIVFDFDGVLVESVDIKTKAFAHLFMEYGSDIVEKVVEYHLSNGGVSRFDKFKYYYQELLHKPLNEEASIYLSKRFSDFVVEQVIQAPMVSGAGDFLDKHHDLFDLFVVSATPQEEIEHIVKQRSMDKYFKKVFGSPREKHILVSNILKDWEYKSSQTIVIGDAMSDYQAADKTGCHFAGRVMPGSDSPFPQGTRTIEDITSLSSIINTLNNNIA